tara:strand:+ start:925 stop:1461 length:537 start_codon:yes stop_codon:yes gene_type:complete
MKKTIIIILFLSTFISCQSIRVSSDFNQNIDFSNLKTYAFLKEGIDKVKINDIDKKRILKAIDVELYNKGFRKSSIDPDFIINFSTETNQKVNYYPSNNYYGSAVPYGGMSNYASSWYLNSFKYNEGVLFIDIVDNKKNELVWQGIGKGYIYTDRPEKKIEKINAIVGKILLQFPPEN